MAEPQSNAGDGKVPPKAMTVAEAARAVRRPVTKMVDGEDKDGNAVKVPAVKYVAVPASEVLAFKDYGDRIVVVTKDGQKFASDDQAAE